MLDKKAAEENRLHSGGTLQLQAVLIAKSVYLSYVFFFLANQVS